MKIISAALLLLGSGVGVDGAKNPHGFDPKFLKAMTQGAKSSPFLKDVTVHERKAFWRNLLQKAKPASETDYVRKDGRKLEREEERKLDDANNYANYANANNGNYNQNADGSYNGNYNQNNYQQNDNDAQQYNYNGEYNYGDNQQQYNYNGNADAQYDEAYYEAQNANQYSGVNWQNLGFDMKQYSLKYTGCSAVKTFDSNMAAAGYDSVLSTKRFALFRLCPSNNCNKYSVNGCGRNYGEYVLEMDTFLEGVVEFNRQRYWHYCHFCRRCNGLETYGEKMSELSEEEMEFYEQMQAEAEEYYEAQQAQYQQENQDYANENAANYDYYNAYQNNGNNANNANNGGRKVRKLKIPKTKKQLAGIRALYENQYSENANGNYNQNANANYNQNAQAAYYQYKKQQQADNGEVDYEDYQQYQEQMNNNMYNNFYWDESVYGEWDEDWSESWLAFNWQVLPYCSESELYACADADTMCEGYDDDFEEDADAMGGFSACTQIDEGLYIGPHCNSDGFTITLGVYSDQYCDKYIGNEVSLYDVLGYDLADDFDFFPQECVTCEEGVSTLFLWQYYFLFIFCDYIFAHAFILLSLCYY